MKPTNINKILVFRLSSIGDIILTTALLRCLRNEFPHAQIDFVVKKQFAPILRCVPYISNVIELDTKQGFVGIESLKNQLHANHYDAMLDIHKNWRSFYIRKTINANCTYTFNKHVFRRWVLTTFHKDIYKEVRPVYLRFIDAAAPIGVKPDGEGTELIVPQDILQSVDNIYATNHLDISKPIIAFCPGASFTNKQWPTEKFAELAKRIVSDLDIQVVLIGGKNEQVMCDTIIEQSSPKVVSLAGALDLSQSIAALSRVKATVANDTGMLHASEALGVPVVGIYGATARQFGYYPILPTSKVAEVDLPCRPCTKMGMNTCPKGHFACMQTLSVDYVFALLKDVITR